MVFCFIREPDEASDAKRACTDNEDNKCFFQSNFSLCSNQSNHRTEIDCLSFQQEIRDGPFNDKVRKKMYHHTVKTSLKLKH
jgi:hypothetical protein